MTPAWIGLGANLGDAATTVGAAITALDGLPGTRVLQASRLYATPAWGNEDQPPFVNAVAAVETSLAADELLQAMLIAIRGLFLETYLDFPAAYYERQLAFLSRVVASQLEDVLGPRWRAARPRARAA